VKNAAKKSTRWGDGLAIPQKAKITSREGRGFPFESQGRAYRTTMRVDGLPASRLITRTDRRAVR